MNGWVTLFAEPWIQRLGWVLIHFLWQGTGIALLLAVVLRVASRASSNVRYMMIGSTFLLCAVLPVTTWMIIGPQASSSMVAVTVLNPTDAPNLESPVMRGSEPHTDGIMESPGNIQTHWQDNLSRVADASLPYVVGLWFVGVLILTLRLTMGWMLMRRVCLSGLPIHDAFCLERFRVLLERMQVGVPVRLLESALVEVPTLIGWLRPTILVPASVFMGLTPDQLEAILAHELSHVRRYDYLVNLVQTVIETILFYHPAVWWISRKLREERENCCDDIALEVMQNRLVYASALALLEEGRGTPLALTASGGSLLHRIRRIVGANEQKISAWPLWMLIVAVVSIACLTQSKAADKSTPSPTAESTLAAAKKQQIINAVKNDDTAALTKLVDGINVGKILDKDRPLLFVTQNLEIAKILLEHGADPNARWGDSGEVPLFRVRSAAMVDVLLAHGADPKLKSSRGDSVLDYVHDLNVFEALLRGGVPFDAQTNGPDMLVNASRGGNILLMTKLLALGVDPNKPGAWFRDGSHVELTTPLMEAVNSGWEKTVTFLLDHGAKTENDKRKTMVVAVEMHPKIAKLLWDRGNRDVSPLLYAISQGASVQDIAKLLDQGSPVDPPQDNVMTPLGAAAQKGNLEIVKLLVARGADVNKSSFHSARESNAPVALAAFNGQDEVVGYLLAHGAKPDPAALYEAARNSTPYQNERSHEHFEKTVRLLLEAGALKNATPEEQGYIVNGPIWTRQGPPNATVLKMILDAGGNPNAPMPYTEENGEKPNTVIGYYRDYCAQHKEDPAFGTGWEKIKPLLDMLEATDKGSVPKTTGTSNTIGNPAITKALIAAAQKGDAAQAAQLLKQGADPKANLSPDQKNALFVAAENNQVEVLKLLLKNGADPNCANSCGNAPIDWTLSRGNLEAATVLHDAGAKISPEGWAAATGDLVTLRALASSGVLKKGKTDGTMHYATSMGQLEAVKFLESIEGKPVAGKFLAQAARSGNIPMLDYILSRGANIKTDGGDAMDQAIIFFNQPESVKWLLAHGVDPNHFSKWNEFSLAECKSAALVKLLLDAGANPNGQGDGNDDMDAPLVHAPDAESVRLLVQHGANLKPKFKDGYTLIDIVTSRNSDDKAEVIAELIKQGAEFDPKGNGATALARAAAWNHLDTMQVLLDHGVSPSAYSDEPFMHCSALTNAAREPSPEAVKFLLDHGANPNGDPRDTDTPLAYAVMCDLKENVEILRKAGAHDVGDLSIAAAQGDISKISELLKNGANINETDHAGNTPLYYSVRRGHPDVARLLIQNGANVNPFNLWGQTAQGEFEFELAIQGPNRSELDWGVPEDEGNRRRAIFKELFAKYPVNPNYQDSHGRTPLHQSAFAGNSELDPLRDNPHPACLNLLDNDGNTPLILAALSPQASELVTKISVSDPKHPDKSMKDWNGAAYIADRLIKAGAKVDLKMPNGQTQGEVAMAAAVKAKNPQLISVLHDAGVAESSSRTHIKSDEE